jgi:hypothetical protein
MVVVRTADAAGGLFAATSKSTKRAVRIDIAGSLHFYLRGWQSSRMLSARAVNIRGGVSS